MILFVTKLNAYAFDRKALKLIYDYVNGRSQKIRVCYSFSSELDISYGVPQGSILGLLLFNINICYLLFDDITSEIANHADDTTPRKFDQHYDNLMSNLELTIDKIISWFGYESKCFEIPFFLITLSTHSDKH